ncbi:hypothetical protein [Nocardia sp. NPDC003345]
MSERAGVAGPRLLVVAAVSAERPGEGGPDAPDRCATDRAVL